MPTIITKYVGGKLDGQSKSEEVAMTIPSVMAHIDRETAPHMHVYVFDSWDTSSPGQPVAIMALHEVMSAAEASKYLQSRAAEKVTVPQ